VSRDERKTKMNIRKYDPSTGAAFQGDIVIMPLPAKIRITSTAEIPMRGGMLILAEGELTGHHHGFVMIPRFRDDGLARALTTKAPVKIGTARLYRDPAALRAMIKGGVLTTDSLCLGFLRVEEGAPPVTHDEHDGIQLLPGEYYIGAKREWDAGEARRVQD
jgi:hypothetical protein